MSDGHAAAWDRAPVGLLRLDPDGLVLDANATALAWLGRPAAEVVGRSRIGDLLSVGGRMYWETHLAPLLHVEGRVDEVALELRGADGRLPVLATAVRGPTGTDLALTGARDRLRFERDLRVARSDAVAAERRVSALQQVTAALSQAVGVAAVVEALLGAVRGPLRAAGGSVWLAGPEGRLELAGSRGSGPVDEPPEPGGGSRLVLPVHGQRGLRGSLVLVPPHDAGADPLDRDVCRAVAQQAGPALDRADAYEQSASVASQLQRALSAVDPPEDPRFDVAAVYRPGVETLEVGGDWYDVFLVRDGLLAVVVGDVVGRGLGAATAMGQLRSAVRALASDDLGPGRLLSRLDAFTERTPEAGMATLVYAELDLVGGRLRFACAGHPPPVLLPVEGPARLLWGGRSTPLGSFSAPALRPEEEVALAPGERVLLCTDGVFERRYRDLDEGLGVLLAAADRLGHGPLAGDVTALTDALLADEGVRDDACTLLLEWVGDRFAHRMSGDLTGLSGARHALGRWLGERGVEEHVRDELVLAASEALANAAEHGLQRHPGRAVDLQAWLLPVAGGAEVRVQVRDGGRWRHDTSDAHRGRGLRIMRALVDELDVRSDDGTTVLLRRRLGVAS